MEAIIHNFPSAEFQVVIGEDSAVQKDFAQEIFDLCRTNKVPSNFRKDFGGRFETDYVIAVSWRWIIDFPQHKLIVLHDSLLPRYRGFAPLPNALINGEKTIGVTALFGAKDYDRGAIISQQATHIEYPICIKEAIEIVSDIYSQLVCEVFSALQTGEQLASRSQNEDEATYSPWRDSLDYIIDWTISAREIRRFVDALGSPYSGAITFSDGDEIVVVRASEVTDVSCELRHPGKVLFLDNGMPIVVCGSGLLRVEEAFVRRDANLHQFLPLRKLRTRFE